jgi:hypothetical protein
MTGTVVSQIRTVSFGDVDGEIWGAALSAATPALVVGNGAGTVATIGLAASEWSADGSGWRLAGDGFDLHVEPGGEELTSPPEEDDGATVTGFQELCRVQGMVRLAGAEHPVDCVGTRSMIDGIDAGSLDSVRAVSGWLGDDEAFALLALRASRGVGQESDLVAATLFDPESWVSVQDPRLSTTYGESGLPTRTNLELWIGEGENEFPRRAAGEAAGEGAGIAVEGFELRVVPMRCHSRGREGTGVYVLASF